MDLLIRNLDEQTTQAIDREAANAGISRNEYLIRYLTQHFRSGRELRVEDFSIAAHRFADVLDPEVMRQAWT